ncbi:MAG: 30S ribosomal protein S3, partial [archaeon]|nr:30S ribosomal protein S3 [archaeon]
SHKVHPKAFRLEKNEDWRSRWMDRKTFPTTLKEDYLIRTLLEDKLKEHGLESVEIERFGGNTTVIINSSRPGLIIGRGGSGVELLKRNIQKVLKKEIGKDRQVKLEIREIKNPWTSAALTGQQVAQQLEKRMPYRRILKQTLDKVMANKDIEGARIEVAGRLGGADIARRERVKAGRLPLQTIRANIDYALTEAHTTYGVVGIKVWMYKGERFD